MSQLVLHIIDDNIAGAQSKWMDTICVEQICCSPSLLERKASALGDTTIIVYTCEDGLFRVLLFRRRCMLHFWFAPYIFCGLNWTSDCFFFNNGFRRFSGESNFWCPQLPVPQLTDSLVWPVYCCKMFPWGTCLLFWLMVSLLGFLV